MGDKGGKKNKEKGQKQSAEKQKQKAKDKFDKQPKESLDRKRPGGNGHDVSSSWPLGLSLEMRHLSGESRLKCRE